MGADDEDLTDDARVRSRTQLQRIADELGCSTGEVCRVLPDEDAELFELLRLWHAITDPVGRRRLLILARQEAAWSGYKGAETS